MFPYLTKIIEIGLRWAAIIPFSVVPCLDSVDFHACLTLVLFLTWNKGNSSFQNKYGHWELVILYNTDKSSTFFHWRARAILRIQCWTRGGVIFGIRLVIGYNVQKKRNFIGCLSCQLALPLCKIQFHWSFVEDLWRAQRCRKRLLLLQACADICPGERS